MKGTGYLRAACHGTVDNRTRSVPAEALWQTFPPWSAVGRRRRHGTASWDYASRHMQRVDNSYIGNVSLYDGANVGRVKNGPYPMTAATAVVTVDARALASAGSIVLRPAGKGDVAGIGVVVTFPVTFAVTLVVVSCAIMAGDVPTSLPGAGVVVGASAVVSAAATPVVSAATPVAPSPGGSGRSGRTVPGGGKHLQLTPPSQSLVG